MDLLDAIDSFRREPFQGRVWRIVREGRDPLLGSPSQSCWCNGTFDVLYTCLEEDGAVAEIYSLLSLQPVFPSKISWHVCEIRIEVDRTLRIADLETLQRLGVDTARYKDRTYVRTQEIADAAYFLGFDGLQAPSARWSCDNLVLFTDRIAPDRISLSGRPTNVDWGAWRSRHRADRI
jgi:hypothetical protein